MTTTSTTTVSYSHTLGERDDITPSEFFCLLLGLRLPFRQSLIRKLTALDWASSLNMIIKNEPRECPSSTRLRYRTNELYIADERKKRNFRK